ncbi:MAG TPA: CvpA family protein [Candidatus Acidoferrales bacterium]|nr:CvpA family protein [Candidatus Acidoferrales bacterium]
MNALDWFIIVVLAFSALFAALKGFALEVLSLIGAVLGYLLAAWYYPRLSNWFQPHVSNRAVADAAGFLVIFVAVMIAAGLVGRIISWAMKKVGLRWFDRLLGMAFGLVRGSLIVVVVLLGLTSFGIYSKGVASSQFAPYFLLVGRGFVWAGPNDLQHRFHDGLKSLQNFTHVGGKGSGEVPKRSL